MSGPRIFRLRKTGLARVLGDLEARVMEVLWNHDKALSVQDVCRSLGEGTNYKTIMTVLTRLVDKGLLQRHREGRAFLYRPRMQPDVFLKSVADDVVQGLIQEYGDVAVASFIHALDTVSPDGLARLERVLRERRTDGSPGGQGQHGAGKKDQ